MSISLRLLLLKQSFDEQKVFDEQISATSYEVYDRQKIKDYWLRYETVFKSKHSAYVSIVRQGWALVIFFSDRSS